MQLPEVRTSVIMEFSATRIMQIETGVLHHDDNNKYRRSTDAMNQEAWILNTLELHKWAIQR